MSSYQHKSILGNFLRDSLPDYLTCGYCAKEFLLDNITLFIAHKMGDCDKNTHTRTSNLPHIEDTSSPLTCSSCSRVFMTARGLHHVQEDHQMVLCLQKGPLYLPDNIIKPPPAHTATNTSEFTMSDKSSCCCSRERTSSASEQGDQPTDLSMTCSNSLGKARVKCSEDKCEITIEPINSLIATQPVRSGSALPKKRKFMFSQNRSNDFNNDMNIISGSTDDGCAFVEDNTDTSGRDGNVFLSEETSDKTVPSTNVSINVTAEYKKDTLCCVSLSTEKKEPEKHAKLKRLLQNNTLQAEHDELPALADDTKTTTVVYKVPFLAPLDLESATLKASCEDNVRKKTGGFDNSEFSTVKTHTKSSRSPVGNILKESTLEQHAELSITPSVTSGFYTEDFEILSPQPDSSYFSGKHLQESGSLLSMTSIPCSPCLIMPDEKNKHLSKPFFNFSSMDIASDTSQRKKMFVGDALNHHTNSVTASALMSSVLLVKSPPHNSSARSQTEYPKNPMNVTLSSSTTFPDPESPNVYSDSTFLRDLNNGMIPKRQATVGHVSSHEDFTKISRQVARTPFRKRQSAASVSFAVSAGHEDSPYRSPPDDQWLTSQSEDCVHSPGASRKSRSASDVLDNLAQEDLDQVCLDSEDINDMDVKTLKKRRYPTSRPFKCDNCDQAFNQRIHLKKHMSKHTGVKPFKCQQCDYSTVERSHLKVHNRIHTGEKPYRCMYCEYATAQNSTLKIHMKRHHEGQATCDFSRLRDNSQLAGSLDDDEGSLQATFFLGIPIHNQSAGRDVSRSASALSGRIVQSLSTEDPADGVRSGDSCGNSSSSSSCTGHVSESLLNVPSLRQVQGEHSTYISDKLVLRGESHRKRKLRRDNGNHAEMHNVKTTLNSIVQNENTDRARERLTCKMLEDSTSFVDGTQLNISRGVQSASTNAVLAKKGDNLQSLNSGIVTSHKKKKYCNSKLVTRNKSPHAIIESSRIMQHQKHNEDRSLSYSLIDPAIPRHKELVNIIEDEMVFHCEQMDTAVKKLGNRMDPELMKVVASDDLILKMVTDSEHTEGDVEGTDVHCSPTKNYPVIPEKAFVRG